MRVGRYTGFVTMAFVVAACAGSEVSTEVTSSTPDAVTSTESAVTTSTTVATIATTTTLSADLNVPTAEAATAAIYNGDEEAIDNLWASPGGPSKQDAVGIALFEAALNVNVLASSCDGETSQVVECQVQATDDLSDSLGIPVFTDIQRFTFNDSGEIVRLVSETHDGGVGEVFTNWAWNIAYPGICDSPAQCAAALLDVVDEYNETYAGAVVASYVAAYNAADVDAVVDLFADDSVIIGHPGGDYEGVAEIRTLHEEEADGTVAYDISNVVVDGDTVTWDHHWGEIDDNGLIIDGNCVDGHTAEIEDGMFASWTWPVTDFQCG